MPNSTTRRKFMGLFFVLTTLVTCVLSFDAALAHHKYLWERVAIPASLLIGLIGTMQTNRFVAVTTATVAWFGIALFFILVILTRLGYEWFPQGPGPFLLMKFAVFMMLGLSIATLFASLTRSRANNAQ